jgi:hypothetical protein
VGETRDLRAFPDMASIGAQGVEFCVDLGADVALADLLGPLGGVQLPARGTFGLLATYRRRANVFEAFVLFQPSRGGGWHVTTRLAAVERRGHHPTATAVGGTRRPGIEMAVLQVGSRDLWRLVVGVSATLAGKSVPVHAIGEFRLSHSDWQPVLELPKELWTAQSGRSGVDLLGVRLGWQDRTRNVVLEAIEPAASDFRVLIRSDARLEIPCTTVGAVLGHLEQCLLDVAQRRREEARTDGA